MQVARMQTEEFTVLNVKCGGCTSTIEKGLGELPGVEEVSAVIEGGHVTVKGEGIQRELLANKLAELGYPEA